MNKKSRLLIFIFLTLVICITSVDKVSAEGSVSNYELAMLATLVYEDVPNDATFSTKSTTSSCGVVANGCIKSDGSLKEDCSYSAYSDCYFKRENFDVLKYMEGLSNRKLNLFTAITTTTVEDGETYYMYDISSTDEMKDWKIVDYSTNRGLVPTSSNVFDAVVFNKQGTGDYVISFRGTDFPDVMEWLADIAYAAGTHSQANAAYTYAKTAYDKIKLDYCNGNINNCNTRNINIYVTGHSLGGYLAQVGAIGILEKEKTEGISRSLLEQVGYFNGMGISGLGLDLSVGFDLNLWMKDLIDLATHDRNGNLVTSNQTTRITNYNEPSSGRLVLYQMDGDPVSEFGLHFGEIINLEPSLDTINHHTGTHEVFESVSQAVSTVGIKASNVSEYLDNAVKKFLKFDWVSNKSEARLKFGEALANTLSIFESAGDVAIDSIYDNVRLNELPNLIQKRIKNFVKTPYALLSFVLSSIDIGDGRSAITKIVETANISHETDSFLCLNTEDDGRPNVTVMLSSESTENNIEVDFDSATTIDGRTATTVFYYGGESFKITADSSEGCARRYQWIDENGNDITTSEYMQLVIPEYSNEQLVMANQKNGTEKGLLKRVRLRVYYGNEYRTMLSDGLEYEEISKQGDFNKYVEHIIEIRYENEGPICTMDNTSALKVALEKKWYGYKNKTVAISFSCFDPDGISTRLTDVSGHREPLTGSPFGAGNIGLRSSSAWVTQQSANTAKVYYPINVRSASSAYANRILVNMKFTTKDKLGFPSTHNFYKEIRVSQK